MNHGDHEGPINGCQLCQATAPNLKRGRGRPPEGVRVDVRIPADLLKLVDRDAKRADVKRAERIRQIIAAHYT